jgi:hypothetical protein
MKPTVYVETTIPSYLTAWASRDLVRAAHQQIAQEWWAQRNGFDLYSSRLVVQECQAGDTHAAADRLGALAGIPLLEQGAEAAELAEALMRGVPLPEKGCCGFAAHRHGGGARHAVPADVELHPHRQRGLAAAD